MNQYIIRVFSLCLLILFAGKTSAQQPQYARGEIIVKLRQALPATQRVVLSNFNKSKSLAKLNQRFKLRAIKPLLANPPSASDNSRIGGFYLLSLAKNTNIQDAVIAYNYDPLVAYAQPNYVYRLHSAPNDSLFDRQISLQTIRALQAWEMQTASPDIIVGVIDTGIDYVHEDLAGAIWINRVEDLNSNGKLDAADLNNIDDDGNGFIDDIFGWDFTDAPAFPDGGDYLTPDNDPFDENGHGTAVAGIIAATGNNRVGIAGLAYGCRIMPLRAGTSLGFLEEDDVASALLYAIDNGARIINMSFGDEVASPLLHDVMVYAYERNCILVASAGNSFTDRIHFPSGFATTISVGATTAGDQRTDFSNYGSSLDLVAPGVNVLTTNRFDEYGLFSGTSASAPLVSALAALILSKTPQLSNESVKGLLLSTADDLGAEGWDNFFAGGRINAEQALQSPYFSVARITHPDVDRGFARGAVKIRGTAAGTFLQSYRLEIGAGETPTGWTLLFEEANRQRIDAPLYELDISTLIDSTYTLRLLVLNKNLTSVEDKVRIFIDRTAPVITNIHQTELLDGDLHTILLEFDTDELATAAFLFRQAQSNSLFTTRALRFNSTSHRLNFSQSVFVGQIEYFIKATNGAGLTTIEDNNGAFFPADLSAPAIGGRPVDEPAFYSSPGFLLNKVSDFDNNGNIEFIINEYDSRFNFTSMKILEFLNDRFVEKFSTQDVFIPRDWGDPDGDCKLEILAGRGSTSFIFEAPEIGMFPTNRVWENNDNAWAANFADLDQDGKGEIILRINDVYTVWENSGDNSYTQIDSFPNPTPGENFVGVPHAETGDFDGDGLSEILFGDFDGDIYLYENRSDNRYEFTWSDRMPLLDAIDYLTAGDFDGDGFTEFAVGSHTDPTLNLESNFDSRHWIFRIYHRAGDDLYLPVWQQGFFGFQSPVDFDSGVSAGDVDNDDRDEVLISVFPDFYIVDFDPEKKDYVVIWHSSPARSNATIVADVDGDGFNEFFLNSGESVKAFRLLTEFAGPATPTAFQVQVLDSNEVRLSWQSSGSADRFIIYRSTQKNKLATLATTTNTSYFDKDVVADTTYFYAVSAIDSSLSPAESRPAQTLSATPGPKPFLAAATAITAQQILLRFNEAMSSSVQDQTNYIIENFGAPGSAIFHKSGREVVISSPTVLPPGVYTVVATKVFNLSGTPIDTLRNRQTFTITAQLPPPYLEQAELTSPTEIKLTFSEAMEPATTSIIANFEIKPGIVVTSATPEAMVAGIVRLQLSSTPPIGPFGKEYFVRVRNVRSLRGQVIEFGKGDTAALIFANPDLSKVFAYPNPYHADSGTEQITIAGLTPKATVRILDISGRLLKTLHETDGNGGVDWDLRDDSGQAVASGIYIFYVVSENKKALGKFVVVR